MKKIKERNYFIITTAAIAFLMAVCIASFVICFVSMAKDGSVSNNIFEIIYLAFHFIVLFLGLYFAIIAIKNGSQFMKSLMFTRANQKVRSKTASIIALVLSIVGFVAFTYFFLALFVKQIPSFNFPIVLIYDLINTPLSLFIIGLLFYFYPISVDFSVSKGE